MREMAKPAAHKARNTDSQSSIRSSFAGAAAKPAKVQSFQRFSSTDSKVINGFFCFLYD